SSDAGETHLETAAAALSRQAADVAAVAARDLTHQRKPETRAGAGRAGHAMERLEDALALLGRHAGAAVRDREQRAALARRAHRSLDLAVGVQPRVLEQVA